MISIDLELAFRLSDQRHVRRLRLAHMLMLNQCLTFAIVMRMFEISSATARRDLAQARRAVREHRAATK